MTRPIPAAARAALAGLLLLGASVAASAEVVYNRGNSAEPETLDPHRTSTIYEAAVLRDMYEGLVAHDAKANVIPGVAESWTVSRDGRIYTFAFRDDARWSNGEPVRPADFVFSMRRILTPATASQYSNLLYPIQNAEKINTGAVPPEQLGVRAVDDGTLEITLEAPTPYFLGLLTHQSTLPVHPPSVRRHGDDFVRPGNTAYNGAYVLKEQVPNDRITLTKNPNFHDAANVRIDTVNFYPTEDRGAALRRFQAGELHSNNDVPTEQLAWIRDNLKGQFRTAPYLGNYYYTVNTTKPPFNDPRVRRALSMAIDREFLAEEIWGGTMKAGYSLVTEGTAGYGAPASADYKDTDPIDREDEAARLLEEAGFGPDNPLKVQIRYNTSENHKNTAVEIANAWEPLGVETTLLNTDTKTHYAFLREKGDYDVARAGWIADYDDPESFLFQLPSGNTQMNYANYKNPEFDALMAQAATMGDLDARAKVLHEAEALAVRDLPFIPILHYLSKNLISPKLKGWEDNSQDIHPTRFLRVEG